MKGRGGIYDCGFHITYLTPLACINVSKGTLQTRSFSQIQSYEGGMMEMVSQTQMSKHPDCPRKRTQGSGVGWPADPQRSWQLICQFLQCKRYCWGWNHDWIWYPRSEDSGWNIKRAPTHRLCSGPVLQSAGTEARCEYIQDAYEYWQLRPQPAVAPGHMWPHSFNNVASESHIKEWNHPVQVRRCWWRVSALKP